MDLGRWTLVNGSYSSCHYATFWFVRGESTVYMNFFHGLGDKVERKLTTVQREALAGVGLTGEDMDEYLSMENKNSFTLPVTLARKVWEHLVENGYTVSKAYPTYTGVEE